MDASGQANVLEAACETIRALLAQALRDEVLTRHEVGRVVLKVLHAEEAYGTHAVERIATRLGVGVDGLYRAAAVATIWSGDAMRLLSAQVNCCGEPLSWSHWVTLAKVRAAPARERLFGRCLAEAWSVRDLRRHLADVREQASELEVDANDREAIHAALVEGLRTTRRAGADLGIFTEALAARLASGEGDEDLVARAMDACDELEQRVHAARAVLQQASRSSERRVRVAVPVLVEGEEEEEEIARDVAGMRLRR